MSPPSPDRAAALRLGVIAGLPFMPVVGLFGVVYGVIAIDAGLTLTQTMASSLLVFAGTAQLTALQLMQEGAPFLVVVMTALAVNLRMTMYSVSLAPHLGRASVAQRAAAAYLMVDQAYAIAFLQFERTPHWPTRAKLAFYFGAITPIAPIWNLGTLLGAALGDRIPQGLPIDFIVPVTFLALIGPMLRTWAHAAATLVSVVGALVLLPLPWSLGAPLAAVFAMAAGALVETLGERHRRNIS